MGKHRRQEAVLPASCSIGLILLRVALLLRKLSIRPFSLRREAAGARSCFDGTCALLSIAKSVLRIEFRKTMACACLRDVVEDGPFGLHHERIQGEPRQRRVLVDKSIHVVHI